MYNKLVNLNAFAVLIEFEGYNDVDMSPCPNLCAVRHFPQEEVGHAHVCN